MSKFFSRRDRRRAQAVGRAVQKGALPDAGGDLLDGAMRRLGLIGKGSGLAPRRQGLEALEPRLLLSGDPLSAAFAINGAATLQVVEVQTAGANDEQGSELRLQLVQGVQAGGDTVLAERRIVQIDGNRRVIASDGGVINDLSIVGGAGDDRLRIDQSVMSLADGLEVRINLAGGADELIGPESSNGAVWSIDAPGIGELSLLQPTGDEENPDEIDTTLDSRVMHAAGRDHFATFESVETVTALGARDILADRQSAGRVEYLATWTDNNVRLERMASALAAGPSNGSTAPGRAANFVFAGAEGLVLSAGLESGHLNFSQQIKDAAARGASLNLESGEMRLFDALGQESALLQTRGLSDVTGTTGRDEVRIVQGVRANLLGGSDLAVGGDTQNIWTLNSVATSGRAEASLTMAAHDIDEDATAANPDLGDIWRQVGSTAEMWGIDALSGGDKTDRLVLSAAVATTARMSGSRDDVILDLDLAGVGLRANGVEQLTVAHTSGTILDYTGMNAGTDVEVDLSRNEATGFERLDFMAGAITQILTGNGNDVVIAAEGVTRIDTGAGDDAVTLAAVPAGATLTVDLGDGTDLLLGDLDAQTAEADPNASFRLVEDDNSDPLSTRFVLTQALASGWSGTATFVDLLRDQVGGGVIFSGAEAIQGQGATEDPDELVLNLAAPAVATWHVTEIYEGTIVVGGQKLSYTGVAYGENIAATTELTLSYAGDGADIVGFDEGVNVDIRLGFATGFGSFGGIVHGLVGTRFNDALLGGATTKVIAGGTGRDIMGVESLAGARVGGDAFALADAATESDILHYRMATGIVTLTDAALTQGTDSMVLSGFSEAYIRADESGTAGVTIDASAFSGRVTLEGGVHGDLLIGAEGTDDLFILSGGSDTIQSSATNAVGDQVGKIGLAGNATGTGSVTSLEIVTGLGTSQISGVTFVQIIGDAGNNNYDFGNVTDSNISITLMGEDGDDTLIGGAGNDRLSGGLGVDMFQGRGGSDALFEQGFSSYILTDTTFLHASEDMAYYELAVDLETSTAASDWFELKITDDAGVALTTQALDFDATDRDIHAAIAALRQHPANSFVVTTERVGGRITSVTVSYTDGYAGRDLGLSITAIGFATDGSNLRQRFENLGTGTLDSGERAEVVVDDIVTVHGYRPIATLLESISDIETFDLLGDAATGSFIDTAAFSGTGQVWGSFADDRLRIRAGSSAYGQEGDDRIEVVGTTTSITAEVDGGLGYDRLKVTGSSLSLSDTALIYDTGSFAYLGLEELHLVGTSGADVINASGLSGAQLQATSSILNVNLGRGLPIRMNPAEGENYTELDAQGAPVGTQTLSTDVVPDLTVTHGDGSTDVVDFAFDAETVQDLLDAFNAVNGLSAAVVDGRIVITSTKTGSGQLTFSGVAVQGGQTASENGTSGFYIDESMLDALGLRDANTGPNQVTARFSTGVGVMIDGLGGADNLTGSAGDDLIIAGGENDTVVGGGGNDHLIVSATNGPSGNYTLTGSGGVVNLSGALNLTATGIELTELRGSTGDDRVIAGAFAGDLLYRTRGGADVVTLGSGENEVIVEGAETLTPDSVRISLGTGVTPVPNANTVRYFVPQDPATAPSFWTDGFAAVQVNFRGLGIIGADLDAREVTRVTGTEEGGTTVLNIDTDLTLAAGEWEFVADRIVVGADVQQFAGLPDENGVVFQTSNFKQGHGTAINTTGDLILRARQQDLSFPFGGGIYNANNYSVSYLLGTDVGNGRTGPSSLTGRNVGIDIDVGAITIDDIPYGFDGFGTTLLNTAIGVLIPIIEKLSVIAGIYNTQAVIDLQQAATHSIIATGTGEHGDITIDLSTTLANKSKPMKSWLIGVAIGIVDLDQTVTMRGQLIANRDISVRSTVDVSAQSVSSQTAVKGIGLSAAITVMDIQNHILLDLAPASSAGRDMRVEAHSIERVVTDASAANDPEEKGSFNLAIGVALEIARGSTTARLTAEALNVGRNLIVDANVSRQAANQRIAKLIPITNVGVFASGMMGMTTSNYVEDTIKEFKSAAQSNLLSSAKDRFKSKKNGQTKTPGKTSKLDSIKGTFNSLKEKAKTAFDSLKGAKDPNKPPKDYVGFQLGGGIAILSDQNSASAILGTDGRGDVFTTGGLVRVNATVSARPKMGATALVQNAGTVKDDKVRKQAEADIEAGSAFGLSPTERQNQQLKATKRVENSKYAMAIAANVGIMDQTAVARIAEDVEVTAIGSVAVTSAAQNRIDPLGLWGVNIGVPLYNALRPADFKSTDGVQDVSIGTIVEHEGERFASLINQFAMDLGTQDYLNDTTTWTSAPSVGSAAIATIGAIATHLDSNFGLGWNLFDLWAQSFARGEKLGVAISASVLITEFDAKAQIGDRAQITVTGASDGNGLSVTADAASDSIALGGNFGNFGPEYDPVDKQELPAGKKQSGMARALGAAVGAATGLPMADQFVGFVTERVKNSSIADPRGDQEKPVANAVGAAVNVLVETSRATSDVGAVTVTAHDMTVAAQTSMLGIELVAAGGESSDFGLAGSWSHRSITTAATAQMSGASQVTLTGKFDMDALDTITTVRVAGAIVSTKGTSVGISGITTFFDRTANALILPPAMGFSAGFLRAAGDVTVDAMTNGVQVSAAIAGTVSKKPAPGASTSAPPAPAASSGQTATRPRSNAVSGDDQRPVTSRPRSNAIVSRDGAGQPGGQSAVSDSATKSKAGVSISGSAIGIDNDVNLRASIAGLAELTTGGDLKVAAEDRNVTVNVSGAAAMTNQDRGVGVAGAFIVLIEDKAVEASILMVAAGALVTAQSAAVMARDRATAVNFAAGLAAATGQKGAAVSGSVIVVVSQADVIARLSGATPATPATPNPLHVTATNGLMVSARKDSAWVNVAGAIAYGSTAGVGVGVVVAYSGATTATEIENVRVTDTGPTLLEARNESTLASVSAAVAATRGTTGGAGAGAVALNIHDSATVVTVTDSNLSTTAGSALIVDARENATLVAIGGGVAAAPAGTAAIGIGAGLNFAGEREYRGVSRGAEIAVTRSTLASGGNLVMLARSEADLTAVGVAAAVAKSFALAGSVAVNRSSIDAKVLTDSDSALRATSLASVGARSTGVSVAISGAVGVGLGAGASGAGGAGIAVNLSDGAVIADVNGDMDAAAAEITAIADVTLVTVAVGAAGSGGFAIGGSVAVTEATGDVVARGTVADGQTWTVGGLAVTARDSTAVTSVAGGIGIGLTTAGVGAAVGVVINSRNLTGELAGSGTVTATNTVTVSAGARAPSLPQSDAYRQGAIDNLDDEALAAALAEAGMTEGQLNAQTVNIGAAIGGSKMVGVGINVAVTVMNRDIIARLGDDLMLNIGEDGTLLLAAEDAATAVTVSVGAAAAIGAASAVAIAIAGSVAVTVVDGTVAAEAGTARVTLAEGADATVRSSNDAVIFAFGIGAAVSVGGTAGGGAAGISVGVNKISSHVSAISSMVVTGAGADGGNTVTVSARNDARITGISVAAAVAATTGKIGLAGAGAVSVNVIASATTAVIAGGAMTQVESVSVSAHADSTITSVVLGIAVGVAAGAGGGAGALGVAVSVNVIRGIDGALPGALASDGQLVVAQMRGAGVVASGAVNVTATSEQTIRSVVLAASVAVAATGGFGLSVAGAGAIAVNRGAARVLSEVTGGAADLQAGSMHVEAVNVAQIVSVIGSAAVAVSATGSVGIAATLAVGLANNALDVDTQARITGFGAGRRLDVSGALVVNATTESIPLGRKLDIGATSVAASVAIAATGAAGFALAGAGADARNSITGGVTAEVVNNDGTITADSVSVTATSKAMIRAEVVAVAASVAVSGGAGGGAVALGGTVVRNIIGSDSDAYAVTARIRDSYLDVAGTVSVIALNDVDFQAVTVAAAGAFALSSDLAVALVGAGADSRNVVRSTTTAEVMRTGGDRTRAIVDADGVVSVRATEDIETRAVAIGAAIAGSVSVGGVGVAAAIGVALSSNDIISNANAVLQDTAVDGSPFITAGAVDMDAVRITTATGTSVAASIAASFGLFGSLALSGAGADVTNRIGGQSEARVQDARVVSLNQGITIEADSAATSTAATGAAAVAASAGLVAGAGSIGVSIVRSDIGVTHEQATRALVVRSDLRAATDLVIDAAAVDRHHVFAVAASVAIAVGIGGAIAGAGLGVTADTQSDVIARATDSTLSASGDIRIVANSDTQVDDSVPGKAGNDTITGVVASAGLGSVAILVSILRMHVASEVAAEIMGGSANAGRNLIVDADHASRIVDMLGIGVTLAGGYVGVGAGGVEITLDVTNDIRATIDLGDRAGLATAGNNLSVTADETVEMSSGIANVAISAAPIGLALGAAVLSSTHGSTVRAKLARGTMGAGADATLRATSNLDITRTAGTGVAVGMIGTTVNIATASAQGLVEAVMEDAQLTAPGNADLFATYDAYLRSGTIGIAAGLGAFGAMNARTQAGLTQGSDAVVRIDGTSRIVASIVTLDARVIADMFSATVAGGGGGLAAVGAESIVREDMTAEVRIGDGAQLRGSGVNLNARGDRSVDGTADAFTVAVASGAGAYLRVDARGDAKITFEDLGAAQKTEVSGRSIRITTLNAFTKDEVVNASRTNNVMSGSASASLNLNVIGGEIDVGGDSDKVSSRIDMGDAILTGVGTYGDPSSISLRTLTQANLTNTVQVEAVAGLAGLAVATSKQRVQTDTGIALNKAQINNALGNVEIATREDIRNIADAAAFQGAIGAAVVGVDVVADTKSNEHIQVDGSEITGRQITLVAGLVGGLESSLITRTDANASILTLGVGIGVATQRNGGERNLAVDIGADTVLKSAGNLFLRATDGTVQRSADGLVVVIGVPPYGYSVAKRGSVETTRTVDIDPSAELRAGANHSLYYRMAYAPQFLQGDWAGALDGVLTERELTVAEKARLDLPADQPYLIGWWDSDTLATDLYRGDIVTLEAANATTARGQVGAHYEFIGGDGTAPVSIAIQNADFTDSALWRRLNAPLTDAQAVLEFGSDSNAFIRTALRNEVLVIRPQGQGMPTVSVGSVEQLLTAQYEQVRTWLIDHNTNEEAVIRYQAQLEQIARQLADLGLPVPTEDPGADRGNTAAFFNRELQSLFVQVPDLVASPGSIFISSGAAAANYSGLIASGTLKAHADVQLDVLSNLYMMHRVGDVVIDSARVGRISEATNDYIEFAPGSVYVNDVQIAAPSESGEPSVQIVVNPGSRVNYAYIDAINTAMRDRDPNSPGAPTIPPDLYVLGSIVNPLGAIEISNISAGIRVSGQLLGKEVRILSGGDFTVSTDWYHAGADPRQYDGVRNYARSIGSDFPNLVGYRTTGFLTPNSGATINLIDQSRFTTANNSAVVANGEVSIVASYVNVNGLIQSGVISAEITVAADFLPPSRTQDLSDENNVSLPGITFGTVNGIQVPMRGQWDAARQQIVLEEMRFAGGRIDITGQVYSTGYGTLRVASGQASVHIRNESRYGVILNGIDTSLDRAGVIQITDTLNIIPGSAAKRTVYTKTDAGMTVQTFRGDVQRTPAGAYQGVIFTQVGVTQTINANTTTYAPQADTFYVWTEGLASMRKIVDTKYQRTFSLIFN